MILWQAAQRRVIEALSPGVRAAEAVPLARALGRVLAEEVRLDRDQPPFRRSTRDGFAVRAADVASVPARLRVVGEVRAGQAFGRAVAAGECVEIFTGAPVPDGADAVVMVEDSRVEGDQVVLARAAAAGENVVATGAEGRAGQLAIAPGVRLGFAQLALCASVGVSAPRCAPRPRVAILSTGDEIVPVDVTPGPTQIRNSNAVSLAAQVERAGGEAVPLPAAGDTRAALRAAIEGALAGADLLVLSGGVSMGKYDLVEPVLAELGAETIFDGVAIRPGKPVVFGRARGTPWFGLPGNPLSTMVTFELLARPAIAVLAGETRPARPLPSVTLAAPWRGKPLPLALFLPCALDDAGARLLASQGSGDLANMAGADGWVVVPPGSSEIPAATPVQFMTSGF